MPLLSLLLTCAAIGQTIPRGLSTLAMIRTGSSDATVTVEFWDGNGNEAPSVDSSGIEHDYITLTVSSTAKSLAQFIAAAGYNTATNGVPKAAVGCSVICTASSLSSVAYNYSGTADGSVGAGNGIQGTSGRAPSATSPNVLAIGSSLVMGMARSVAIVNVITANPVLSSQASYGDGSDGVVAFDGVTTVLGLAPSTGVYTLTRDIYLASGSSIAATVTIKTANYRIYCNGTLTLNGTIDNSGATGGAGGAAVADAAGAAGTAATALSAGSCQAATAAVAGGAGGAGSTTTGAAGGNGNNGTAITNSIGVVSGVVPAAAGLGGAGTSAAGAAGTAGTDGTVGALASTTSGARAMPLVFYFLGVGNSGVIAAWKGNGCPASAAGGSAGGGDSTNKGGGGGGSGGNGGNGGYMALAFYKLVGSGTISSNGGTGGAGGAGGNAAAGNCGGGGGGAGGVGGTGGVIVFLYHDLTAWTGAIVAGGGPGGAGAAGGTKQGTGVAGGVGATGTTGHAGIIIKVAA